MKLRSLVVPSIINEAVKLLSAPKAKKAPPEEPVETKFSP